MHRSGHLLVEQDVAARAVDPGIGADPDLAQEPRSLVARQRGLEIGLAFLRPCADDLAVCKLELDARTVTPGGPVGNVKRIVPLADCSCGPVNTSPLGMFRLPSELIQPPVVHIESQVGAVGLDPDLSCT